MHRVDVNAFDENCALLLRGFSGVRLGFNLGSEDYE
jgi:hypothetical protein